MATSETTSDIDDQEQEEQLGAEEVNDMAPLMHHAEAALVTTAHAAVFWEQIETDDPNRPEGEPPSAGLDLATVLETDSGRRVMARVVRAVQLISWGSLADGIAGPDLEFLAEEAAPLLARVPLLRQLCESQGIDPDVRMDLQLDRIPAPWEREAYQ